MLARSVRICTLAFTCLCLASAPTRASEPVKLETRLAQSVMKGGETQKNFLRIALHGCKPEPSQTRTPVNVAFVIDRSGSMQGPRIAQAREAAIMAINRLLPTDIASVVTFDHMVDVLAPAQPVSDPGRLTDLVQQITVRGSTAIHAGVVQGAAEVAKFKEPRRLNRVVLLSDGQANIGPMRPDEFAALGSLLLAQGISVSTIGLGLGYNEDLMQKLARASDGNHAFARDPSDLIQIFNREFNDVLGSCAQTVSIDVELKPGVRALRALSREGTIEAQRAQFKLAQVYAATEHYVLLEVEIDKAPGDAGEQELGVVKVTYTTAGTGATATLDAPIRARFSQSDAEVKAGRDPKVAEAVVEQITRERTVRAISLQDQGKIGEARELLLQNATDLNNVMATMPVTARMLELRKQYQALGAQATPATPEQLNLDRKLLRQLDAPAASAGVRY
jgi:Ca-activated chloride channel homolog